LINILNSVGLSDILNGRGLIDILNGSSWLIINLRSLLWLLFSYRGMNDLSFNSLIFNSFSDSFLRNVFDITILINLRNVFSLILNGVIISDSFFFWNVFGSLNCFIFNYAFFVRNIFNS